jgi:phosphatidylserine/phosphatidylglycerophosphate/cardiolipin synthase-like enzyme
VDLTRYSTAELERLLAICERQRLTFPLSRLALQSEGLGAFVEALEALNGLGPANVPMLLRAVLQERRARPPPELVWTGPEARGSTARDTAVVLADLFTRATTRVLLAGFAFDHAEEVLAPLHAALQRGVSARVFADATVADEFLRQHWPFGPPFPEVFGFVPNPGVFASLHAKCVVVDGRWVFATSANFTNRGQSRNVEVGLLVDDASVATALEAQFSTGPWSRRTTAGLP